MARDGELVRDVVDLEDEQRLAAAVASDVAGALVCVRVALMTHLHGRTLSQAAQLAMTTAPHAGARERRP
jgi:hypothetical protein